MMHRKRIQKHLYTPPQVIGEKEVLLEQALLTQSQSVTMHFDANYQEVEDLDYAAGGNAYTNDYNFYWD